MCEWVSENEGPFEWKTCEILPHQINSTILAWIQIQIIDETISFAYMRATRTHTGEREMHSFVYTWTLFKTIRSLWIGVENWSIVFAFGSFVFDLYFLSLFLFHEIEIHLLKAILDFRPLEVISWHPEPIETWSRFSFFHLPFHFFFRSCAAAFMIHFIQWSTLRLT